MNSKLVLHVPSISGHSCVDLSDLAQRVETVVDRMGNPGPGDGEDGVPVRPIYAIKVCLTENFAADENGKIVAPGYVVDDDGNPVFPIYGEDPNDPDGPEIPTGEYETITVEDPTGGDLEGLGKDDCLNFAAVIPDANPENIEILKVGGEFGGGGDDPDPPPPAPTDGEHAFAMVLGDNQNVGIPAAQIAQAPTVQVIPGKADVLLLDWDKTVDGFYKMPLTELVRVQEQDPDNPNGEPIDKIRKGVNFSKTALRASGAEPIVLNGYLRKWMGVDDLGAEQNEELFVATGIFDFRAIPGYQEGGRIEGAQAIFRYGDESNYQHGRDEC